MECEWKPCFSDNDGSETTFNENDKFCAKFGIVIRPVINTGGSSDYNDLDNKPTMRGVCWARPAACSAGLTRFRRRPTRKRPPATHETPKSTCRSAAVRRTTTCPHILPFTFGKEFLKEGVA